MNLFFRFILIALVLAFLSPALALLQEGLSIFGSFESHLSSKILFRYGQGSLLLVLGSVMGAIIFGGASAYLCSRFEFPMRRLVVWFSLLPLAVPSYLVAYTWVDFLVDQGVPGGVLRTLPATCIIFALCLAPYVFLPCYGALSSTSRSFLETAQVLGKKRWQIFFLIELPLVRPSLVAGSALAAMEVLADFGTVDFMAVDTWSTGVFRSWFGYGDRGQAAALALVLFCTSGVFLFWQNSLSAKKILSSSVRNSTQVRRQKMSVFKLSPLLLLALCPPLLSCFIPATLLLERALFNSSTEQWLQVLPSAFTTLWISILTSVLVVSLGLLLTNIMRSKFRSPFTFLARLSTLGYAFPGGVLGLGILILLAHFSLTGTIFGLIYAYCIRFVTIGSSTVEAGWLQIPSAYIEQARVLGCSAQSAFFRVTLPLLKKSMGCAFILTCIDVIKELPATMILRPFNFETLALRTYTFASDERLSETAPSSLLMIVLCLTGVWVAEKMGAFGLTSRSRHEQQN